MNKILNIILLYKRKSYSGELLNFQINERKNKYVIEIENNAIIDFFLSDKKLSEFILLDIFQRKKEDFLSLKILFSFKYDFLEYINNYQEQIIKIISKNTYQFAKYLLTLDTLGTKNNIDLENKLIISLSSLLIKNNIYLEEVSNNLRYYPDDFILNNKNKIKKNYSKLCFIFNNKSILLF